MLTGEKPVLHRSGSRQILRCVLVKSLAAELLQCQILSNIAKRSRSTIQVCNQIALLVTQIGCVRILGICISFPCHQMESVASEFRDLVLWYLSVSALHQTSVFGLLCKRFGVNGNASGNSVEEERLITWLNFAGISRAHLHLPPETPVSQLQWSTGLTVREHRT